MTRLNPNQSVHRADLNQTYTMYKNYNAGHLLKLNWEQVYMAASRIVADNVMSMFCPAAMTPPGSICVDTKGQLQISMPISHVLLQFQTFPKTDLRIHNLAYQGTSMKEYSLDSTNSSASRCGHGNPLMHEIEHRHSSVARAAV